MHGLTEHWKILLGLALLGVVLFARGGLVGCTGRVWSPSGRQRASGTSTLICRPNPELAGS